MQAGVKARGKKPKSEARTMFMLGHRQGEKGKDEATRTAEPVRSRANRREMSPEMSVQAWVGLQRKDRVAGLKWGGL